MILEERHMHAMIQEMGWQKDGTYVPIHIIKELGPDVSEKLIKENEYDYLNDRYHADYNNRDRVNESHLLSEQTKQKEKKSKTEYRTG